MKSVNDINIEQRVNGRSYFPSPLAWEDEVMYFLLVDRFADSRAEKRPLYNPDHDYGNIFKSNKDLEAWHEAADRWNGGNLNGLTEQLDYLQELGITVIWISPILRQVSFESTYHGYGIQNFLAIDPHFGSSDDFRNLVDAAHERGMYVILDVIINHTGNVFSYAEDDVPYRREPYPVAGFNNHLGEPLIPAAEPDFNQAWPDGGVWPRELMNLETFSRCGSIVDWDRYPDHVQGDFYSLKNICTGSGTVRGFTPSAALQTLVHCYQYWIAYADLDGFRLDTVKHLEPGATRWFTRQIHEFAHTLGKHNFYIVGEITGGTAFAMDMLRRTGLNAALGINEVHEKLEHVVKGLIDPGDYFELFRNSQLDNEEGNRWLRNNVIVMFDDHDMVAQLKQKRRFSADHWARPLLCNAIFLNLFSMGMPCLYYGTEQGFDGEGGEDKYVREAMFGSPFGAFRSQGRHFFDRSHPVYRLTSQLSQIRREHMTLRYGRQYMRQLAVSGGLFAFPVKSGTERYQGITAWSRILSDCEYVLAINSSMQTAQERLVLVDARLNPAGSRFICLISSSEAQMNEVRIIERKDGIHALPIKVPAAGFVIYCPEGKTSKPLRSCS